MKRYDLIVIGDLLADIILPVNKLPLAPNELGWADGLFTELGGGGTTLVAARRLNLSVAPLEVLGDDEYGNQIVRMLADEGVDVAHVVRSEGRQTVACLVVTDKGGQHLFINLKNESQPERCPAEWPEVVEEARSILTSGYTLHYFLHPKDVLALLQHGRRQGIPIFFDPGPTIADLDDQLLARVLRVTDVLLLTLEEARHLVDGEGTEAADALRTFGPSVVVLKVGADGCYVSTEEGTIHQPGFEVAVVDTVGAGDAFVAAFIAGYLRGASWRECAALGNAMGAAVVATQGAGRRVPGADRIGEILGGDPAVRVLKA